MAKQVKTAEDPEITAISEVYASLKDLDSEARARVLKYVSDKFNIPSALTAEREDVSPSTSSSVLQISNDDELEGISPAAKKWITRNAIKASKLMSIFSLGIDEIDLVSKSVPGKTKTQRMRDVFLLKGIAAYLGTGTPRYTHKEVKEACLHYDAWDAPNSTKIFKSMSAEISGGADVGYTLTAKGLSEATILIKSMIGSDDK